jgi:5-methylcytosine-specific restriction protein A
MKKKICNSPGCNVLIDPSETYCSKHRRAYVTPFGNANRSNENLYNTSRWRKLRNETIAAQPRCVKCGVPSTEAKLEVHHVVPPRGNEELFFDTDNLVVVCSGCHRVITNGEIRKRRYG